MKQILNKKWISTMIVLFVIATYTYAQRPHFGERIITELGLSDAQTEQVEKLRDVMRVEMKALRQQERSPELREQMKAIMDKYEAGLETILTPEQKEKWETLREDRRENRRERMENNQDRRDHLKSLRDELESYREQNITPVLLEQRVKLEQDISEEDKSSLSALRTKLETAKTVRSEKAGDMKDKDGSFFKHKGERRPDGFGQRTYPGFTKRHMDGHHRKGRGILDEESRETLKGLVEKYAEQINALMVEIEGEKQTWKEDIKEIHKKNRPERLEKGKGKMAHKEEISDEQKAILEKKHQARFLLMDPNLKDKTINRKMPSRTVNVFPNPGTTQQKLDFEVLKAGKVTVEIVDNYGNVVKKVFSGNLTEGENTINVSVEDLKGKNYFYRITDGSGTTSTPVVIQ